MDLLETKRIPEAVDRLRTEGGVVAPVARDGRFVFETIERSADARLDAPQTVHSAKSVLFPSEELLMRFDLVSGAWSETSPEGPRFLLGLHACDLHGLDAFDRWMTDGTVDHRYERRRTQAVLIAVRCLRRCAEAAYCDSMGTSRPRGEDVLLTPLPTGYAVEARTPRGEEVLRSWKDALRPARPDEAEAVGRAETAADSELSRRSVDLPALPKRLAEARNAGWWHDMAARCLDCGQCVAVCPTCTCFGMADRCDVSLTACERWRIWDGCMLLPFAEVAGGHNFRRDRHDRIRHRMNRKGNWLNDRFGVPFCTGCGRCETNCPVGISPLKVFRRAQGEAVDV